VDPEIVLYAFRYALGRKTYAPVDVAAAIEENLPDLTGWTDMFVEEIDEAESRGGLGMECDRKVWLDLRDKLGEGRPRDP
jgi:hypothetical protein